jgi:hypothetical protein
LDEESAGGEDPGAEPGAGGRIAQGVGGGGGVEGPAEFAADGEAVVWVVGGVGAELVEGGEARGAAGDVGEGEAHALGLVEQRVDGEGVVAEPGEGFGVCCETDEVGAVVGVPSEEVGGIGWAAAAWIPGAAAVVGRAASGFELGGERGAELGSALTGKAEAEVVGGGDEVVGEWESVLVVQPFLDMGALAVGAPGGGGVSGGVGAVEELEAAELVGVTAGDGAQAFEEGDAFATVAARLWPEPGVSPAE